MSGHKTTLWAGALIALAISSGAVGETYSGDPIFGAGTGPNSATIVLDFDYNCYFIFTYNWEDDATPTAWDALYALTLVDNGADNVTVVATDWGDGGMFVNDIAYPTGIKFDYGDDPTVGWNMFISVNNQNWIQPWDGCSAIKLMDGDWLSWVWTNCDSKNWWTPRRGPGGMPVSGPQLVTVQGKVNLEGYQGDYRTVGVKVYLQSLDGGDNITQYTLLAADGSFSLSGIVEDNYTVTVQGDSWLKTVKNDVEVLGQPCDIGTFSLKGADANGDSTVSFEDFAMLQNNYGQTGTVANPLAAAATTGGCGPLGAVLLSCLGLAFCVLGLRQEQ